VADEPDLAPGVSSEWVSYLQQMLNHHYQQTVVHENGSFDDATASAVAHFRQQNNLPDSSTVDSGFWNALLGRANEPEAAADAGTDAGAKGGRNDRHLTSDEVAAAYSVFHGTLDTAPIILSEGGILAVGGYARTLPDHVTFPAGTLTNPPGGFMAWLIHELGHCWQYQQGASVPGLIMSALGGDYDYGGEQGLREAAAAHKPFSDFGYEEQAEILADYYRHIGGDTSAFDPYITSVRNGTWQSAP
jgi:peptidoglycan hydrolase-like protein with peptidoglycan-binding domain